MTVRLQEHVVAETAYAMREAFNYAGGVPADKLNWKPFDAGRSVLDITRELAKCADWGYDVLDGKGMGEEADHNATTEWDAWQTVEDCERAAAVKLERFYEFVRNYPDDKLAETIDLPFGAGGAIRTFTMAELMDYPRWNACYHQGQIAYIQTLYGDMGTH